MTVLFRHLNLNFLFARPRHASRHVRDYLENQYMTYIYFKSIQFDLLQMRSIIYYVPSDFS